MSSLNEAPPGNREHDSRLAAAEARRKEISRFLEDQAAVDRLTLQKISTDARARRHAYAGYSMDEIEQIEVLRTECIQLLYLVLACSSRAEVIDGAVQCTSTRADEFHRRLSRFNRINPGHRESLAAHYLRRIYCGEVI